MANVKIKNTISECIAQIQSTDSDYEVKEKALQTLVSITKASPSNRNLLLQNNEFIPIILTLLNSSSSSPTLVKLSLSILFNLSLNPNLKSTLADMATIQHLNTIILSRGSVESSRLAASLICSLAMLDKNKAVFGVANTIQALLKAVSGSKGHVTHHLLSSLAELAQFHGNCTLAVRADAVNVLLRVVENKDCEDLSGTALVVLGLLARFDEGLKAIVNTPNIVGRMLDVLKGRCMMSNEGAAEILIRVFDESEECLKEAMGLPDLTFVLAEVSVRGSTRAREKASLLLKKLEANESDGEDNLVFMKW
ncbi:putative armadillo-like helical protein [Helianthus annuus]|nr:putative armadillo-like helical protein [Helianthus annuus]